MLNRVLSAFLIALLVVPPYASAAAKTRTKAGSSGSRVLWTLIGAGIGFGTGVLIGLNKFDDAINSDRKVWTTAIVGAVAGGVAGGLLSRNVSGGPVSRSPAPWQLQFRSIDFGGAAVLRSTFDHEPARLTRVRTFSPWFRLPPHSASEAESQHVLGTEVLHARLP